MKEKKVGTEYSISKNLTQTKVRFPTNFIQGNSTECELIYYVVSEPSTLNYLENSSHFLEWVEKLPADFTCLDPSNFDPGGHYIYVLSLSPKRELGGLSVVITRRTFPMIAHFEETGFQSLG